MLGVLLGLGAALALLVVGVWVRRRVVRRLDSFTARLRAEPVVASGRLSTALDRLDRAARPSINPLGGDHVQTRRYRASLESMDLGVVLLDGEGRIAYRNPLGASFLEGRHSDAFVGQAIDDLARASMTGEPTRREVHIYGPPRRRLSVTASPIVEGGERLGAIVLIDDTTEQERIDAIRRDFVANISHELRTPIGAVSLLAETLADERDPEVVARLAARIRTETERLAATVADLLELSRIEHGSDADFGPVTIQEVVRAASERVRAAAEHASVEIGTSVPDGPLQVWGDARQLTSAVFNLLDNAVKYNLAGDGVVSVRARAVADQIEIVVQDNGIGVPRRDLDRIFERFYRVDRGRSRASGGTGLGLAIVRHVVANHGGRVSVHSTEGEGSTFTIELPALGGHAQSVGEDDDTPARTP